MKKLIAQIMKFGIVGILAFLIDYGVLYFLTEICGVYYLLSSMFSFIVSVIFNYLASMKYVFAGREGMNKYREFSIFVILSIIGLGINQLGMWIMVDKLHIFYMISKIFVTALVMIWNFISRKKCLE